LGLEGAFKGTFLASGRLWQGAPMIRAFQFLYTAPQKTALSSLFLALGLSFGSLAGAQVRNTAYEAALQKGWYNTQTMKLTDLAIDELYQAFVGRTGGALEELTRAQKEEAMKDHRAYFCANMTPEKVTIDGVSGERFRVSDARQLVCLSQFPNTEWRVTSTEWTSEIEMEWRAWLGQMGRSSCRTVDECLRSKLSNSLRSEMDLLGLHYADCADLPYYLRAYFSFKKGLPFNYVSSVAPNPLTRSQQFEADLEIRRINENVSLSPAEKDSQIAAIQKKRGDLRYSRNGNHPTSRRQEPLDSSQKTFFSIIERLRNTVSTATFRTNRVSQNQIVPDFYSPVISPETIVPGTVLYKPTGHAAIVFEVDSEGNVKYMDAHPDNSLTRGVFNRQYAFGRASQGGGFKNWRPFKMANEHSRAQFLRDEQIPQFSLEQFFGHQQKTPLAWTGNEFCVVQNGVCQQVVAKDEMGRVIPGAFDNVTPTFTNRENGVAADWFAAGRYRPFDEYVRARLKTSGKIRALDVFQVRLGEVCTQLNARKNSVEVALRNAIDRKEMPANLPANIYGAEGEWESYSTPGRDINIRQMIVDVNSSAKELFEKWKAGDALYEFPEGNFKEHLIWAYHQLALNCSITYQNSRGQDVVLSFAGALSRVVDMSFNPYQCVERRWGAQSGLEASSCQAQGQELAWYEAEVVFRESLVRDGNANHGQSLSQLQSQAQSRPFFDRTQFDILKKLKELK
jgi:hypothetical protein